jgi:hypothetical protein
LNHADSTRGGQTLSLRYSGRPTRRKSALQSTLTSDDVHCGVHEKLALVLQSPKVLNQHDLIVDAISLRPDNPFACETESKWFEINGEFMGSAG